MVQAALKIALEPVLEADFHPNSFGVPPEAVSAPCVEHDHGRGLGRAAGGGGSRHPSFFDEVDHDVLLSALAERFVDRKVLEAIRALLGAGVFVGEQLLSTETADRRVGPYRPCWRTSTCTGSTGNGNDVIEGWGGSSATPTIWCATRAHTTGWR